MTKEKRSKGQTMIYKTLHRKLKIEQDEHLLNTGVNSDTTGVCSSCSTMVPIMLY